MQRVCRVWVLCLAAAAVVCLGCRKKDVGGRKSSYTIGIVAKSQSNTVFQAAHAGARHAAAELSKRLGVDVKVDIQTPVDEDAQKQAEAIDALARKGVDGIAVSCSEAATLTPAINRAVEDGIPVMCFDSDSPRSKRMCYYGTDDLICGQMVMKELAAVMGEKGTIAILAGNQSAPNLQNRVKGVREELAKHPGMSELKNGHGVFYHEENPERAAERVADAQRANPEIQGWAFVGGWPLFTRNALKWDPGSIKVVSVDALPAQLPYLKSGHVQVLLGQDCYGWGHRSVELLMDKLVNGKDPPQARIIDPLTRVTADNAGEFAHKWEKWLSNKEADTQAAPAPASAPAGSMSAP